MHESTSDSSSESGSLANRPLARAGRSVRSGLRRYPAAIVSSLLGRNDETPRQIPEILSTLAPHALAVSWLGHGGVLCQLGDVSIVTDPVLSERIGPSITGKTIGLARKVPAPVSPACLRGVDLVLITHAHFDHLDKPTLAGMADAGTTVVVPTGCTGLIPEGFAEVIELGQDHPIEIRGVQINAVQPEHWGARVGVDRHRGVNSYIARWQPTASHSASDAVSALFAGDTAATDVFGRIDPVDVAVLGIGAYDPWEHMHATPEQAWAIFRDTRARFMLPVHHSTFEMSDEPMHEPMERLLRAAGSASDRIIKCDFGEVIVLEWV